jgi:hypothetical protein
MHKSVSFILFLLLGSCIRPISEPDPSQISSYEPLLITREAADRAIKIDKPIAVEKAGKFYLYKNYVLVIEEGAGLHIFDNSNVDDPQNIAFLSLLNCTDVAVKDDVLYANQSTDLLVIKILSFQEIKLLSRIQNVANDITPDGLPLASKYKEARPANTIVAKWEKIK